MTDKKVEKLAGDLVKKVYADLFTQELSQEQCTLYLSKIIRVLTRELDTRIEYATENIDDDTVQ